MIQLLNGIKVLLISDKTVKEAESGASAVACKADESEEEEEEGEEEEEDDGEEEEEEDDSDEEDSDEEEGIKKPGKNKGTKVGERMAAASLCVNVGSFSDPDDLPGLAHFLEHMAFMGSEKYKQENAFDEFLKVKYRRHFENLIKFHQPFNLNFFVQNVSLVLFRLCHYYSL